MLGGLQKLALDALRRAGGDGKGIDLDQLAKQVARLEMPGLLAGPIPRNRGGAP